MLANRQTVKSIVATLANMQCNSWHRRRTWCNKTNVNAAQRLLSFRFVDATEADTVAQKLQAALTAQGYTNTVKRTSVESNFMTKTEGGEYIRVRVLFN